MPDFLKQIYALMKTSKAKLECLLGFAAVAAGYFFIWVYQTFFGLRVALVGFDSLLKIPLVALVVLPLVYQLLVHADPLQRSSLPWKSVRFFQAEFPSRYIRERCGNCVETHATCRNFIGPDSLDHVNYWLNYLWRPIVERDFPERFQDTFVRGYRCKLVLGLNLIAGFFGTLALLAVFVFAVTEWPSGLWAKDSRYLLYPAFCFLLAGTGGMLNRPDKEKPTGCWHAWREINNLHVLWMRNNDPLLTSILCRAGANTLGFQPRPQTGPRGT